MDFIRRPYTTQMCFGADDTAQSHTSTIKWFWCQAGAKDLGIPSPFVSRTWDSWEIWPSLGEVQTAKRPRNSGEFPIYVSGQHRPCGDRKVWVDGYPGVIPPIFPRTDFGLLYCCESQNALSGQPLFLMYPQTLQTPEEYPGGLGLGGIGEKQGLTEHAGGVDLGGEEELWGVDEGLHGGLTLGGKGETPGSIDSPGGLSLGGRVETIGLLEGSGGLSAGGPVDRAGLLDAQGGASVGGKGEQAGITNDLGGVALGGKGEAPGPIDRAGGVSAGGSGDKAGLIERPGGLALGGLAEKSGIKESAGGIALGGLRDLAGLKEGQGGASLGGLVNRFGVTERAGGLALGGLGQKLGQIERAGGLFLGGLGETPVKNTPKFSQWNGNESTTPVVKASFLSATTAGNLLVMSVGYTGTVTAPAGWVLAGSFSFVGNTATNTMYLWYYPNAPSMTVVGETYSAPAIVENHWIVWEFSKALTTVSVLDTFLSGTSAANTVTAGPTGTLSQPNECVLATWWGYSCSTNSFGSFSPGWTFSKLSNGGGAYILPAASTSVSPFYSFNMFPTGTRGWMIASFKGT